MVFLSVAMFASSRTRSTRRAIDSTRRFEIDLDEVIVVPPAAERPDGRAAHELISEMGELRHHLR